MLLMSKRPSLASSGCDFGCECVVSGSRRLRVLFGVSCEVTVPISMAETSHYVQQHDSDRIWDLNTNHAAPIMSTENVIKFRRT